MKLYRYIVIAVCLLFVVSYAMAQEPAKENGIPPEFKDSPKKMQLERKPEPPAGETIPVVDGKDTVDPIPAKLEPKTKKVVKSAKVKKEKIAKREKYPDKPRDQR